MQIGNIKIEIENRLRVLKTLIEESKDIKLSLLEHYQHILKEGKDTR